MIEHKLGAETLRSIHGLVGSVHEFPDGRAVLGMAGNTDAAAHDADVAR